MTDNESALLFRAAIWLVVIIGPRVLKVLLLTAYIWLIVKLTT